MSDSDTFEYAPGWRPAEGEVIEGKITNLDKGWSDQGGKYYPIVTLATSTGPVAIHCFHISLEQKLRAIRPLVGDIIKIKYLGKKSTKDGRRQVAVYRVTSDKVTTESFWGDNPPQREAPAPVQEPLSSTDDEDIPF